MSRDTTFLALAGGSNGEWQRDASVLLAKRPATGSLSDALADVARFAAELGAACCHALATLDTTPLPAEDHKRITTALFTIGPAGAQAHDLACRALFVADGQAATAIERAATVIRESLPRDGRWYPCRPILTAVEQAGVNQRTAQRAARRLRIEHRRAPVTHAPVEWRWPAWSLSHASDSLTKDDRALATVDGETVSRKHSAKRSHATTPSPTSSITTTVTV